MDSHGEQVARAREAARGGPMRSYFAYSTILDPAAFEEWKAQHGYQDFALPPGRRAVARGIALTFDFPSRWWGGRVAGLEDRAGAEVHGLVYSVRAEDWPILQHKEGGITGMCVEREVSVEVDGGERLTAVAFTTAPERRSGDGPVSGRFIEALQRGAATAGLPQAYQDSLGKLAAGRTA
jgi:cation transport regulator ChaC